MLRFDYYAATTQSAPFLQLTRLLAGVESGSNEIESRARGGMTRRVSIIDSAGREFGSVQCGRGPHSLVLIEAFGERTPAIVELLRASVPHRVTRVDSCADFDEPRSFERLLKAVNATKKQWKLFGEKRGDWDRPECGRTRYIGSSKSVAMLRLYEKGKQPEYRHLGREHWVRLELQVRPTKNARERYSKLTATEVWGASRWSREVCERLLGTHVDPHPAGTIYRQTDQERQLYWLCRHYRSLLLSLREESGSWDLVGRNIAIALGASS